MPETTEIYDSLSEFLKEWPDLVAKTHPWALNHISYIFSHSLLTLPIQNMQSFKASLETHAEKIQKEWNELFSKTSEIMIQPLAFNIFYPFIKTLIKLKTKYISENISIFSTEFVELLKQFERNYHSSKSHQGLTKEQMEWFKEENNQGLQWAKSTGQRFQDLIQELLNCCVLSLAYYFIFSIKKLGLSISKKDTMEGIIKKIMNSSASSNKEDIRRLTTEIQLVFALNPNTFLELLKKAYDTFTKHTTNIQTIQERFLDGTVHIIDPYCQNLDHITNFIAGYCEIDIDAWLYDEAKPNRSSSVTLSGINSLPAYRHKKEFIEQLQSAKHRKNSYLFGPDLWLPNHNVKKNAKKMVTQLISDLKMLFLQKRAKGVKIGLGALVQLGHCLGIKQTFDGACLLRDANLGTLAFKDLDALLKNLPEYLDFFQYRYYSYFTRYMPMCTLDYTIAPDLYYYEYKKFIQRLSCSDPGSVHAFCKELKQSCYPDEYGLFIAAIKEAILFELRGEEIRKDANQYLIKLAEGKVSDNISSENKRDTTTKKDRYSFKVYEEKIKALLPSIYGRLKDLQEFSAIYASIMSSRTDAKVAKALIPQIQSSLRDPLPGTLKIFGKITADLTDTEIQLFCWFDLTSILIHEAQLCQFRIALFACRNIEQNYADYHENVKPLLFTAFNRGIKPEPTQQLEPASIFNTIIAYCSGETCPKPARNSTSSHKL